MDRNKTSKSQFDEAIFPLKNDSDVDGTDRPNRNFSMVSSDETASENANSSADKDAFELTVTLGPNSFGKEAELIQAGATRLRLNASHMTAENLSETTKRIRNLSGNIRLVIDLQGTKLRLGAFNKRFISCGDQVSFALTTDLNSTVIPIPHDGFFDAISPGDTFSIGDGAPVFLTVRKNSFTVVAKAMTSGALLPKKGVTLLGKSTVPSKPICAFEPKKIKAVLNAIGNHNVAWALSYVSGADELIDLRNHLPKDSEIIAKIERQSAIDNLTNIAKAADGLWICRGDLGEQIGLSDMAKFVGTFAPRCLRIPSLMAGQVFHHLVDHETPTRAEVCQLFDLRKSGYYGVVLSDETAMGAHPVETVKLVRHLMDELW